MENKYIDKEKEVANQERIIAKEELADDVLVVKNLNITPQVFIKRMNRYQLSE